MKRAPPETIEARAARRANAFERGWVDSLSAYDKRAEQPIGDVFDYVKGWNACADYRWADPTGRGVAPDPAFRPHP